MNNEALENKNPETAEATAAAAAAATQVAASEFEEFGTIEVTGNFRGFWRDVPDRDENGNARVDEKGNPIVLRKFKIIELVRTGKVVMARGERET
jgi:acetolactate synthase small subunit